VIDNVAFPGWVRGKRKDDMLRNADLFFLPTYNEGMPMSILDAMGYGLPVVSTEVGGIPKIVINDKNGYCVEPGDIRKMSSAIESLLTDFRKRQDYGRESLKIVQEQFSLERHLNKLEAVYEKVLRQ
jgi:glycosyltransferase involved in cell wall biosynthesis